LIRYRFDPVRKIFECQWREHKEISAPTLIYFPARFVFDKDEVKMTPSAKDFQIVPFTNDSKSKIMRIASSGKSINRRLVAKMKNTSIDR